MSTIIELKEELDDVQTLNFISQAFTEASAAKLQKIRGDFEKNKQFYEEISHVYHLVKTSAVKAKKLHDKAEKTQVDEKTLHVALTSNQHFYGNINSELMRKFTSDAASTKADLMVIGKTGNDFMRSARLGKPYKTLQFTKDSPTREELVTFLDSVKEYLKVFVYYPKFVTLLTQTVAVTDITQFSNPDAKELNEEIHMIFEPELHQMLDFFERTVHTVLFLRVILETDLSRTAARLIAMSSADERSKEMISEKKQEIRKLEMSLMNAQMLETFSGMSKWKK
ncbi:F0F1 ATP synthase subunit gamma [Patescibacteria group bacterium]|nr:F0F1 ATP synthase subunit gamma [Patescibacteria group bacterium]MCL5797640.1 F0F1 ATP synthase subunit gamma [Patescibacteria group bacterium]